MHSSADMSSAIQHIEAVKKAIDESDDAKLQMTTSENLKLILSLLQDPVLRSIVQVQDSLFDLNKQIVQHPSILPSDFDINPSGELILNVPTTLDLYDADYPDEQRVPSAQLSPRSPNSPSGNSSSVGGVSGYNYSSHHHHQNSGGLISIGSGGGGGGGVGIGSNIIDQSVIPVGATSSISIDDEDENRMHEEQLQLQQQQQQHLNMLKKTRGYSDLARGGGSNVGVGGGGGGVDEERPQSAVSDSSKHLIDIMAAEWAQIQSLELVNDGTGLGFGIIGARTSGVIVKTILPGGVADRDRRLISGDHILQIGDVNLHDMVSEQVASVLRQSGTHVRLVVARPIDPTKQSQEMDDGTAIVPARLLSNPNELERYLIAAGYPDIFSICSTPSTPTPIMGDDFTFHEVVPSSIANRPPMSPPSDLDLPETERFNVELTKDINGLGITIAGYVCEKEELSGIFVKSVSPGSAADLSERIQVNDRIIEVDQQSLQGYSNHQAVEVLKKSGNVVNLCLERYLRGPKYEQLQQAIAANETTTTTPSTITPTTSLSMSNTSMVTPIIPNKSSISSSSSTAVTTLIRPHSGMSMGSGGGGGGNIKELDRRSSVQDTNNMAQKIMSTPQTSEKFIMQGVSSSSAITSGASAATVGTIQSLHKTTPIAVVSGSSRKLAHARDSIENKYAAETAAGVGSAASSAAIQNHMNMIDIRNIQEHEVGNDIGGGGVGSVDDDDVVDSNMSVGGQQKKMTRMSLVQAMNVPTMQRHKYWVEPILTEEIENTIKNRWSSMLEADATIIVAQIRKFAPSSGLGISLEGTVDVEGGMEVRPHHYIRSILPEGPVGQNALLRSGDELLEVNGQRLLGMNHLEVVSILKELPQDVRMVCARCDAEQLIPFTEENIRKSLGLNFGGSQNLENLIPASERLVKAKSDGSLATSGGNAEDSFTKLKSRSLEPLTGLAMWSSEPQIIELMKGERGLGFSILDYQDPLDANDTLIVIRSLVPGGVAQLDGRLIPGDRLLFVNDINLENSSLDQAVQALKGAPKGVVRIGVAKPLPMADNSSMNLSQNHSEMNISDHLRGKVVVATTSSQSTIDPDVIPEWKTK